MHTKENESRWFETYKSHKWKPNPNSENQN